MSDPTAAERMRRMRERQRELALAASAEEMYVRREVEVTGSLLERGALKEVVDSDGRGRLERSEAYARWRWRSFRSGEVASL